MMRFLCLNIPETLQTDSGFHFLLWFHPPGRASWTCLPRIVQSAPTKNRAILSSSLGLPGQDICDSWHPSFCPFLWSYVYPLPLLVFQLCGIMCLLPARHCARSWGSNSLGTPIPVDHSILYRKQKRSWGKKINRTGPYITIYLALAVCQTLF